MRVSKREMILDSIVDIIEQSGVTAVTFDAIAAETGITRGGLLYHFPSREALILATHQHMAAVWEADMQRFLGKDREEASADERIAAYIRNSARSAKRSDLLLVLEGHTNDALSTVWNDAYERWAPPLPDVDDPQALARFIVRLAADGLWMSDYFSTSSLSPQLRERISDELVAMLKRADDK